VKNVTNQKSRELDAMNRLLLLIILGCLAQVSYSEEALPEFGSLEDEWGWEEESILGEEIPMVLTASRLKQPKAEVPASVTVISSEQIKLWGVRTFPELMKFVPGMFVGHADDDNNASVTYHTSNPNTMRRLQVLIDGRSVYKSAIAMVVWDDLGLALEDIDRIEVTRGPNAAVYGANSYLGVINILTKHPEDSQGSQVSWSKGNKGVQDVHFRHGLTLNSTSLRISGSVKADEGFDGRDSTGSDALRDGRKHGFINAQVHHKVDDTTSLDLQLGYKSGKTEMRQIDFDQTPPDKTTTNGYAYGRWQKEFSLEHQSHLQLYWQKEDRQQDKDVCVATLALDSELGQLYRQNSEWADIVAALPGLYEASSDIQNITAGLQAGAFDPATMMGIVESFTGDSIVISQQDLDQTKIVFDKVPDLAASFSELTCGKTNTSLAEQRIDVEWQDTMRWTDDLRTVSGLSYRRDSADSPTYFNGGVSNDTWRAFANLEYRVASWLVLNAGGMYEIEAHNDDAFSPKLAANFLLGEQHSIRLVASQAVRSPDLLESQPEFIVNVTNLVTDTGSTNYLNLTSADFYQQKVSDDDERSLTQERITSVELGYFVAGDFFAMPTELDVKIFHEELRDMISDPITLQATNISNDNEADVDGAELQLSSKINSQHSLWLTYSYIDVDNRYVGDELSDKEIISVEKLERRLSSENSTVVSWMYSSASWSASLSYFNQDTRHILAPYERYQLNLIKPFQIAGLNAEMSYYIQHNRQPKVPLNYSNQIYSSPNIYYAQLSLEF
jgi:iron complex outermembrane recepter protein